MPAKVLADTNVWIAFFRGDRAHSEAQAVAEVLDSLLVQDRIVGCGVVEMELYQGVRDGERSVLEAHLSALDFVATERQDFRAAGNILNVLRQQGLTIPSPDALIAALCLRHDLMLLEHDRHFAAIPNLKRFPWRQDDAG